MADQKIIVLAVPIRRGSSFISGVKLRKPGTADLEGVSLPDLLSGDDRSVISVLARITMPPLTSGELVHLNQDAFDDMKIFLLTKFLTKQQQLDAGIIQLSSEA